MPRKPSACPECGSLEVIPIVYGYPADMGAYLKAVDEGRFAPGGCCVDGSNPDWHCRDCEHRW